MVALAVVGCRYSDSDIAPDVAAHAARAAAASVAFIDLGTEALVLAPGTAASLNPVAYDSTGMALTNRPITYVSLNPAVAVVDDRGRVEGMTPGQSSIVLAAGAARDTVGVAVEADGKGAAVVHVFPGQAFQRMEGWEAHHQSGELDCNPANFARYQNELFDRAVQELGINRLRLEVRSGMEAPHLRNPGGNEAQSRAVSFGTPWFSPVNDNEDPSVADSLGFQFDWFDYNVTSTILPLRERLSKSGERLILNLTYVDFFRSTPFEQMRDPREYAELLAVTFDHMQKKFGFVPDAVETILEPDNTPWTPEQVGAAIVAAGDRLAAAGFRPQFLAPSTTNLGAAVRYYDRLHRVPRVNEYVRTLVYHRYSGVSHASLHQLRLRARRDGLGMAMLEHMGGTAEELHEDLTVGQVGAWERFALAYCSQRVNPDAEGVYYQIALKRGAAPQVVFTNEARLLRHYFLYVREGAQRIGAASTDPNVAPVAFRNTNGSQVVILRSRRGGPFSVAGLAPGRYAVMWTTSANGRSESQDVEVATGGRVKATIPDAGLVTIYPH